MTSLQESSTVLDIYSELILLLQAKSKYWVAIYNHHKHSHVHSLLDAVFNCGSSLREEMLLVSVYCDLFKDALLRKKNECANFASWRDGVLDDAAISFLSNRFGRLLDRFAATSVAMAVQSWISGDDGQHPGTGMSQVQLAITSRQLNDGHAINSQCDSSSLEPDTVFCGLPKEVNQWNSRDVKTWLARRGYKTVAELPKAAGLTGQELLHLDWTSLTHKGVDDANIVSNLLSDIAHLQVACSHATPAHVQLGFIIVRVIARGWQELPYSLFVLLRILLDFVRKHFPESEDFLDRLAVQMLFRLYLSPILNRTAVLDHISASISNHYPSHEKSTTPTFRWTKEHQANLKLCYQLLMNTVSENCTDDSTIQALCSFKPMQDLFRHVRGISTSESIENHYGMDINTCAETLSHTEFVYICPKDICSLHVILLTTCLPSYPNDDQLLKVLDELNRRLEKHGIKQRLPSEVATSHDRKGILSHLLEKLDQWSADHVSEWLACRQMSDYEHLFRSKETTGKQLAFICRSSELSTTFGIEDTEDANVLMSGLQLVRATARLPLTQAHTIAEAVKRCHLCSPLELGFEGIHCDLAVGISLNRKGIPSHEEIETHSERLSSPTLVMTQTRKLIVGLLRHMGKHKSLHDIIYGNITLQEEDARRRYLATLRRNSPAGEFSRDDSHSSNLSLRETQRIIQENLNRILLPQGMVSDEDDYSAILLGIMKDIRMNVFKRRFMWQEFNRLELSRASIEARYHQVLERLEYYEQYIASSQHVAQNSKRGRKEKKHGSKVSFQPYVSGSSDIHSLTSVQTKSVSILDNKRVSSSGIQPGSSVPSSKASIVVGSGGGSGGIFAKLKRKPSNTGAKVLAKNHFGTHRYTGQKLKTKGVLLAVTLSKRPLKDMTFEFTSYETGVFTITAQLEHGTFERVQVTWEDLCSMSQRNATRMTSLQGCELDVDALMNLLKKKFT